MKSRKLHMIGNAHIDPVWLWQWQEGFHEVLSTFRSALDRMKEYPDFKFVASSAAFYAWVEQADPGMFAEIQQRVAEGRWGIVGGWWVEPDCNIPSGESFARHGLYAQRYFQEKFGLTARTGYNVDSFGHAGTLPQILKGCGIDYYVFLRPQPHEKELPRRLFWWRAADGSQVLAFRIPFEYLSWGKDLEPHARRCTDEMEAPLDESMCFYGVGNHGGGPTVENIESLHRLDADPQFPSRLACSTPEAFFQAAGAKGWPIPVVQDELQHHASGCYAAHSGIKRWNRLAENRLLAAEKWSLASALERGRAYPHDFERAWKNVLFSQFHDILAGTALEAAYQDAHHAFGEALSIADRNLNAALQSFAWNIRIPYEEGARPLVAFNPQAWPVQATVEIESNPWTPEAALVDEAGEVIPHQAVQSASATWQMRLAFTARLPALGYRTYRLLPQAPSAGRGRMGDEVNVSDHNDEVNVSDHNDEVNVSDHNDEVNVSDHALENARFRLELDPQTGCIASLSDKRTGVEVFAGPAARPVVVDDPNDTWAHHYFKWDQAVGEFGAAELHLAEHGPVKSVIRATSRYGASTLIQDFCLYPDQERIDVRLVVDWRERMKMLKLRFPLNLKATKAVHEIPYGHIARPASGEEEPFQSWVDVSGTSGGREIPYGFSLLNDGKYSLDVDANDIGLTVLRSPAYANHIPAVLKPGGLYSFIDQGLQSFSYTLLPHTGGWEEAGTVRRAAELNQPPTVQYATFHPQGSLPQTDSFISAEPENVIVTVLKQAEDGDGLVLRAYETSGAPAHAVIHLLKWGREIEADFGPGEIKTFRFPADPAKPPVETNLLEWEA
jgi:alpha-mannosidase